jgi:hypothetical protein
MYKLCMDIPWNESSKLPTNCPLGDEIDKNKLLAMSDSSLLDIAGRKGFGSYLVDI